MQGGGKLEFADCLRGLACLAVLASHLLGLFWNAPEMAAQFANAAPPPAELRPPVVALVTRVVPHVDLGALGVAVFFLISGFVIPISLDRYSVPGFLVGRCWRLVPTYVVCFALTVGAIAWAGAHYGRPFPYTVAEVAIHAIPGLRLATGSRFIDLVIWTLEVEVLFYVICAACAWVLRRKGAWFMGLPAAIGVAFACSRGLNAVPMFALYGPHLIFMFVGTALSAYHLDKRNLRAAAGSALAALLLAGLALRHSGNPAAALVATSSLLACVLFLAAYRWRQHVRSVGIFRGLALISYPLYVVHATAGYALMRVLLDWKFPPDTVCLIAVATVVSIAAVVHRVVERPTQALGQRAAKAITLEMARVQKSSGRMGTRVPGAAVAAFGGRIRRQLASARGDSRELS
jgi:peptidoglycan/LPS O-acetylase OafA/YrhL